MLKEILKDLISDKKTRMMLIIILIFETMVLITGVYLLFNPIIRLMGVCLILLSLSPIIFFIGTILSLTKFSKEKNTEEK